MSDKLLPVSGLGRRAYFKARLRTIFAAGASLTGAAFIWRLLVARHGVRILAYHGVEPTPSSPFSVTVDQFEKQMAYLSANFEIIDLATLLKWQQGNYVSRRPMIILTFDDGFTNNLQYVAPVLMRLGLPATFFVIGAKLDGQDSRFMTAAQVGELQTCEAFEIGSHTLNHRSVAQIDDQGREEEIKGSKSCLETELHRKIVSFCYPYGTFNDFDQRSVATLKRCGYALACTSVNGTNLRTTDPFRLRRTKVEWSDGMATFRRLANGAMDGWFFLDFFLRFLQRPRAVRFELRDRAADRVE